MSKLTFILTLISVLFSSISWCKPDFSINPKSVYGIDDRMDVYSSSDSLMRSLSHSVAAQILESNIIPIKDDVNITLLPHTLADEGKCSNEKFANQLAVASCSGFLISEDTLVTAGHCVRDLNQCSNYSWIFDYANYTEEKTNFLFKPSQVFHCSKIISRVKDNIPGLDYAVIKLDRKVIGRTPFKMRKSGKLSDDSVLTVLGFPSGLPLKITTGAVVRDNSNPDFFVMNSDTFGGNSGSAVIDTKTGLVEGILVRGDKDYEKSPTSECYQTVKSGQDDGRGEDATRITQIKIK